MACLMFVECSDRVTDVIPQAQRFGRAAEVVLDRALDRSVIGGFSNIGYAVRSRLPHWPADPSPEALAGATAVVTGASSGLGEQTASDLAALGAEVHLVVRDESKGNSVRKKLQARHPKARFHVWRCDLSDLNDVWTLGERMGSSLTSVDVLVHNAGALPAKRTESAQGHELTMALHVLGPVALTEALLPRLRGSLREPRVIFITSGGMYTQALHLDDLEYTQGKYSGATAYARSKRAQVELLETFSRAWAPVRVYATHPGWADTPGVQDSLPAFRAATKPILRDAAAGADTTVWLSAVQPAPRTATLWHDRHSRPTHMLPTTPASRGDRARLWLWVRQQLQK